MLIVKIDEKQLLELESFINIVANIKPVEELKFDMRDRKYYIDGEQIRYVYTRRIKNVKYYFITKESAKQYVNLLE